MHYELRFGAQLEFFFVKRTGVELRSTEMILANETGRTPEANKDDYFCKKKIKIKYSYQSLTAEISKSLN